jgi:anti-sigma regulatory factor (Ser/Thr protein kinase)
VDEDNGEFRAVINLPHDASASALARRFIEENQDHIRPEVLADAELLVSEIVTNALRHGRPDITLALHVDWPRIGVVVTDGGHTSLRRPQEFPDADRPDGRGLLIVDAVASSWGIENGTEDHGTTVWFEVGADPETSTVRATHAER